ncbi:MAG: SH3 domain-containing protein [Anaerolineales bacterium]|nr:SH3 domain-containing protein [Anaerolineales bacterium]
MKNIGFQSILLALLIALSMTGTFFGSTLTVALAQQPTDIPPASTGIFITVVTDEPQINVRMGPSSSLYPVVGILSTGSVVPALGRSQGGDWIQIEFAGAPNNKGWVYSPLVQVSPPGTLQVVEPPPTPMQPATATIDPTLAAQFNIVPTNTRLPTFTPPPSLTPSSDTAAASPAAASEASVPIGTIIIAFAILGLIGLPLSFISRKR